MADRSSFSEQAGQVAGQAQVKKDEIVNKASDSVQQGTENAGGFLQQTSDQVKHMAQVVADTAKSAVGMGGSGAGSGTGSTTTTHTTTKR